MYTSINKLTAYTQRGWQHSRKSMVPVVVTVINMTSKFNKFHSWKQTTTQNKYSNKINYE